MKVKTEENYGTFKYQDKFLTLTQEPYADTDFTSQEEVVDEHGYAELVNQCVYFAHAIDEEEEEYKVRWEIIDHEAEEECDACDWDIYTIRKL